MIRVLCALRVRVSCGYAICIEIRNGLCLSARAIRLEPTGPIPSHGIRGGVGLGEGR